MPRNEKNRIGPASSDSNDWPTTTIRPPRCMANMACLVKAARPMQSTARSRPDPFVASLILATRSGSAGSNAMSAPTASARSRAAGRGSTAATNAAPIIRASWTAWVPSPPTPQIPTRSPGRSSPRSASAAYGVATASQAMAAWSKETPSGMEVSWGQGTFTNSAQPPS
jgi:hypothetical protein